MTNRISKELQLFIENNWNWGNISNSLDNNIRVEQDLNITGDDAIEFLIAFSKKFDVDISDFNVSDYFDPESYEISLQRFLNYLKKEKKKKKILTLEDLDKAIIMKVLK